MKKKAFGTYHIAKICQVAPVTVGRWLDEGKLAYFTTGGGHRRVWNSDLIQFLESHNYPLPPFLNGGRKKRILIVEDDTTALRLIRRVIQTAFPTFEIFEAEDGFDAGHKLQIYQPDLVILDVWLPGIDGIKVCHHIRENDKLKSIRILAISGREIEEIEPKIFRAGADDFLAKPFTQSELKSKISELLGAVLA